MASEICYTTTGLDYSRKIPRHGVLVNGRFVRHLPKNTISGTETYTFNLDPVENVIHPQESFLTGRVKITKPDGTNIAADTAVALSDNVVGTLFKSCKVIINKVPVTNVNVYQAVENYFAERFGISKAAVDIHVEELQGLTTEAAGKNDSVNADATGWSTRKTWTAESAEFEFRGPIPNDFFRSCTTFIPPLQEITIEFKKNDDDFALTGTGTFRFELTNLEIYTRQIELISSEKMSIFKQQAVAPLNLNFTSLEIQSFSIAASQQVEYIRGIFPHQSPHQIFLVLIETDRLNGVMKKDPFKFDHGNVEKVVLSQNGTPVMIEAQRSDFDSDDAKEPYQLVCEALNVGRNGHDANLTYDQYLKGSTMWAWTLSPDMDANNGVGLVQLPGNYEADIYVKSGKKNPALTALFIGKFLKNVQIGKNNETIVVV